jgi:sortase A
VRRRLPLLAIVVGLLLAGGGLALSRLPQGRPPRALPSPAALLPSDAFPEPSPPAGSGLADGERVQVPALGIDLPVVMGDGWDAPLYKAAIYPGLGFPGDGQRSVVYAHARTGMFGPLFHAQVGQRVEVLRPGRTALAYIVRQYFAHWPSTDLRWLKPQAGEELILVTCTTYNPNDPRIVVVAEPA